METIEIVVAAVATLLLGGMFWLVRWVNRPDDEAGKELRGKRTK